MSLQITVVYAIPEAQTIVALELPEGAKVADALIASRIQDVLPGNSFAGLRIGVWGIAVSPDTTLRDRDRVEIYRQIVADPKQIRRQRAMRKIRSGTQR